MDVLTDLFHLQSERQQRLREQARRLIAERTKSTKSMSQDSPNSPAKKLGLSPERTISPINPQSFDSVLVYNNNNKNLANNNNSPGELSIENNNRNNSSPGRDKFINGGDAKHTPSPLSLVEKSSPRGDPQVSYIQSELDALEREQEAIDLKASALEGKLRAVMGGNGGEWQCTRQSRISSN